MATNAGAMDQWGRLPTDPNYGKAPTLASGTPLTGPTPSNPYRYTQSPANSDESNPFAPPGPNSNLGFTQTAPLVPAPGVAVNGNYYPPGASLNQPTPLTSVVGGVTVPPAPTSPTSTTPTTGGVQPKPLSTTAPSGYDPVKWADPNYSSSKYVVGKLVSQYDAGTPEGYAALVAALKAKFPGIEINGDRMNGLPEGPGWVDFIRDFGPGGANGPAWITEDSGPVPTNTPTTPTTPPQVDTGGVPGGGGVPAPGGDGGVPSPGAPGPSGPANPNSAPSYTGPTSADLKGLLEQKLRERINQSLVINENDPIIRNQVEAFSGQQQNARRNYLAELAEKMGPIANISAEGRSSAEQVGQNTSGFQAQLMQAELKARRDEIQNSLVQLQAYLTDEEKMSLEKELAMLDNALQYAKLAEQKSEFGQSLNQQESQFGRNLSQQAWLANLENAYKYAQLGQQGYQFDVTRQDNLFG